MKDLIRRLRLIQDLQDLNMSYSFPKSTHIKIRGIQRSLTFVGSNHIQLYIPGAISERVIEFKDCPTPVLEQVIEIIKEELT